MRRLLFFVLGFASACGVCAYAGDLSWKIPATAAIAFLLCLIGEKRNLWKKILLAAAGCALGFFWFWQFEMQYLLPVRTMDDRTMALTIRAVDYGEPERGFTFFDGTLEFDGKTYQVHTRLKGEQDTEPGMVYTGQFHIFVSAGGSYNTGKGSFLYAYQKENPTVSRAEEQWYDQLAFLRREIKQIIQDTFPEDTFPFAKALLLGDTSDLSYEIDTDLKVSGVRHVVAVSGLHISILFGLLSAVTFRRRFLMALVGYPLLFFFGALTGFTPSVVRSCLMWALVLLARLCDREYDGATSLSFAVLVMLLINPLVITVVSFQLSVASVAGIFLFGDGILLWLRSFFKDVNGKNIRGRLIRGCTSSIAITLSAGVLTVPLCAYYFGMVSLVGVLTNLLTLWVISGIFYGIMAVCLLYGVFPAAAAVLAKGIAWLIQYVLGVVSLMADFPLAAVYTSSVYILGWLLFLYAMLVLFLIIRYRRPWILFSCAVVGLCLALTADWAESMGDQMRFTMLDVGQGQCILLQSEGRTFLVDCGGEYAPEAADQAAEALLKQGIDHLDGLILTHLDEDHSNGAQGLLSRVETSLLILPEAYTDLPQHTKAQVICVAEELALSFGNTVIRIYPATFPGKSNENSLCLLFDTEMCDILITGDRDGFGERSLLRQTNLPEVDILVAGHHGSAGSTCEELLEKVKPDIVCISAGLRNYYGYPHEELLRRLAAFDCTVYRTDLQGTITIRR